ncbi:MAG TPA: dienelactone hydrolase family protein [Lacipirellulaceae bacterium]|jgi:carboxymethylenebutenolidase|nr:dienelactone hydrolase family protein [Lacipirellulaceae bacterium]
MKSILALLSLTFVSTVATTAIAQATPDFAKRIENSPRHGEWADIESAGGRKVHTWVVYPQVDHPATVVLVIHENRGLTDWVRGAADQLAEAGYVAVAPDLLSGTAPGGGNTPEYGSEEKATAGIYKLPQDQVTADLDAVYKYAKGLSAGNKTVAVGGFCWGGGQTFRYATHNANIAAAFVFYGPAPENADDYKKIAAPVYGFYGGKDFRISGEVPNVEKRMKQLGKEYDPVIYEGAGHAFMRLGEVAKDESDPNRKAHDQAWERWKKLLGQTK